LFGENFGKQDVGAAISNLQYIAEYLSGISGRKNLIWLSSKFPVPYGPVFRPISGDEVLDQKNKNPVKHVFAAMMRAQVAIYPVDVKGVVLWEERSPTPAGDAGSDFSSFGPSFRSSAAGPASPPGSSGGGDAQGGPAGNLADVQGQTLGQSGYSVTFIDQSQADYIASTTGGHAYYSDNKISALMEKAIETGESYYTLSYAPSNMKYDGSDRHIEVELAGAIERGFKLTYRNLYYAVSDDSIQEMHNAATPQARFIAAKAGDTLYANIEHGAPMLHDLLFSAHLAVDGSPVVATTEQMMQLEDSPIYFKTRKRNHPQKPPSPVRLQRYLIDYGVIDPRLKTLAAQSGMPATLEFAAAAYDSDGLLLNSILNEGLASGETQPGGKSGSLFHAVQELQVPPNATWIRMAVRDKLDNRTGTLEVRLPLSPENTSSVASKTD
jgi:VWFA-related protein